MLLAVLLVACALATRWIGAPWAVRHLLAAELEARFRGRVTIGDIRLALLAGRVDVSGLSCEDASGNPLLEVRSGEAQFSLDRLLRGEAIPDRLYVEGARLFLALTPEGSNVEDSYRATEEAAGPGAAPRLPHLVLRDCEVVLNAPLALRENLRVRIDGEMLPSGLEPGKAQVQVSLDVSGSGEDPADTPVPIRLQGEFDARSAGFKLSTDSSGVRLSPAVRALLNPRLAEKGWDWLHPTGSVRVELEGQLHRVDGLPSYRISLFNAEGLGLRINDFPYAVQDVQGVTLILPGAAERRGRLVLDNLRGTHGRAIASINGEVYGYLEEGGEPWAHLVLEGRDVPLDRDLKQALEEVDPEFGRIWEAISPQGTADFQCLLYKTSADSRVRAALSASIRNGCFNYLGFPAGGESPRRQGFPYPLTEVSGSFESQLGFTRFDFTGRGEGRSEIKVTGEVRTPALAGTRPYLEIEVQGRDVPLDDQLRRAMLDFNGDRLWNQIQPEGFADVRVRLVQDRPGTAMGFEVELDLKGRAAFVYELVPIRLTRLWGRVRFVGGEQFPHFEKVHGRVAGGEFRLNGSLHPVADRSLEIAMSGPFLGPPLIRALLRSPHGRLREVGRVLEHYGPEGNAEAILVLRGLGDLRSRLDFQFLGGRASGPGLPLELSNVRGTVQYDGAFVWLRNVVGSHDRGWLEINGEQRLGGDRPYQQLLINGEKLDISAARLPEEGPLAPLASVFRELRPRGTLRTVKLELDTRKPDSCPYLTATIGAVQLAPSLSVIDRQPLAGAALPPVLLDRGSICYTPKDGFLLRDAGGTLDRTGFAVAEFAYRRTEVERIVELKASVDQCRFDCPVFAYLGETAVRALAPFEPTGTFDAKPIHLEVRIPEGAPPAVRIAGPSEINLNDCSFKAGPEVKAFTGRLTIAPGSRLSSDAACHFEGRVEKANFRLFGMTVEDLGGTLVLEKARKGNGEALFLTLRDAQGGFYGGRLGPACRLDVMLTPPFPFEGDVAVQGAQVKRIIDDLSRENPPGTDVRGLLTGRFHFLSDAADLEQLEGVGHARVTEGRFGSIPAFVTLFNYFNNHFHRLETSHFEVCRRRIYLGSAGHLRPDSPLLKGLPRKRPNPTFRLIGNALDLQGSGVVNFGGEMEFRFEPRDVWLSTPIPGLKHVLDLLLRQTGKIYVLGTIERVDVQPILFGLGEPRRGEKQPLRSVDQPLWPSRRW